MITIGLYLSVGIAISIAYTYELITQNQINNSILLFGLMGSLSLYGFYAERLSEFWVFSVWTLIAIAQIVIYFLNYKNTNFNNAIGGTYLTSLFYLPLLLVIFSILRLIFKLIFKKEIIINLRRYSIGEMVDGRKVNWMDTFFSVVGMALIIFGINIVGYLLKNTNN